MKKLFLSTLFSLGVLAIFSCSSNKSVYQNTTEIVTSDFQSGYFEKHVGGNEYEVTYKGLNMNQNKVFDLSMLRAADLTKSKGFKNFVVLSKVSETNKYNKKQINASVLKVAMYNDVPGKYQTYYNANDEYARLTKKYNIK